MVKYLNLYFVIKIYKTLLFALPFTQYKPLLVQ